MKIIFQNPPVVEIGITLWIEPSADQPDWYHLAHKLGGEFKDNYPVSEAILKNEFTVTEKTKSGLPKKGKIEGQVHQVNFWSADKDRLCSIGGNFISYRKFRSDKSEDSKSIHFIQVLEEANHILENYISLWKPQQIRRGSVSYVDDIQIPMSDSPLQIEDYLTLGIHAPFSAPISFSDCKLLFSLPSDELNKQFDAKMRVRFYRTPPNQKQSEEPIFRMILQWDCLVENMNSVEMSQIKHGLEYAHQNCYNYFDQCLTDRTKKLFGVVTDQ